MNSAPCSGSFMKFKFVVVAAALVVVAAALVVVAAALVVVAAALVVASLVSLSAPRWHR